MADATRDRGRLRLHHRRRGLGRLRAGQPAVGRSEQARAAARSRRHATTGSGSTSRSATCSPSAIRARTGCSRPSRSRASTAAASNYPRGKVIGGSSAINAMIYMRGQAADYDHWRQLGLAGWGWDDVLPFFKQARGPFPRRRASITAPAANGGSSSRACAGTCSTRSARRPTQAGIPPIADFNTGDNEGSCYFHVNQKRGRRWSAARGFLKPVLQPAEPAARDRLPGRSASSSTAQRAVGVRWRQDGAATSARCRGEVILSAGAIGSPQILLAVGRRPGGAAARARHRRSCSTSRASATTCRTICSCA